jgi:hypothetical protein
LLINRGAKGIEGLLQFINKVVQKPLKVVRLLKMVLAMPQAVMMMSSMLTLLSLSNISAMC